jgi:RNA polymerase sigma-70 factor (ECF subfamily)
VDKKQTFTQTIQKHEKLIYKVASFYTNDHQDREDLVQEIIYQLWRSFESYQHKASMSTWMYRVAMNVAIYHLRKSKKSIATVPLDAVDLHEASDTGATDARLQVLRQLIHQLNLLDRGIVMLYLENKSYSEIADIVGISESNVGPRLSRIKEKLRKQFQNRKNNGT